MIYGASKVEIARVALSQFRLSSISEAEADHVTPVARGGSDDISKIMLAHQQCNREKYNKTLKEHWEWRVKVGLDKESIRKIHGL